MLVTPSLKCQLQSSLISAGVTTHHLTLTDHPQRASNLKELSSNVSCPLPGDFGTQESLKPLSEEQSHQSHGKLNWDSALPLGRVRWKVLSPPWFTVQSAQSPLPESHWAIATTGSKKTWPHLIFKAQHEVKID
jgi:hypothetical protein